MLNTAVLLCLSSMVASPVSQVEEVVVPSLHLKTNVPGPVETRFVVHVNGQRVEEIRDSQRLDLTSQLRRGLNVIDVRYSTQGGKLSRLHPSTLELFDGPRKGARKLLTIRAGEDNPSGSYRLSVRYDRSTRR